jgi:proline iminopeptidase
VLPYKIKDNFKNARLKGKSRRPLPRRRLRHFAEARAAVNGGFSMRFRIYFALLGLVCACAGTQQSGAQAAQAAPVPQAQAPAEQAASDTAVPSRRVPVADYPIQEGYVDSSGVLIYYTTIGRGAPIVIVHGGPGASHDYLLPYLLPLARQNRLIFIDERGSGRSQKLDDPAGYTVENMVEDVEAVRQGLLLGKITLLGHSYGGVLAQAYALKYQNNLSHLILCSTFASSAEMNQVLARVKAAAPDDVREQIDREEKAGLYGHGRNYEKNRYTNDYMIAAWGGAYFPYLYQNHPDPNYDPTTVGNTAWDLYREMWGSNGEFVIDGNLKSVEYVERLHTIHVPTLIIAGDHDECDPALSQEMHEKIADSRIVILPKSGHLTFVDQQGMFNDSVNTFVHLKKTKTPAAITKVD